MENQMQVNERVASHQFEYKRQKKSLANLWSEKWLSKRSKSATTSKIAHEMKDSCTVVHYFR
jgi:hypothetical protein